MVLIDRAEEGIARLAAETKRTPRDAGAWSDLAAAQYAAALAGRASLYPEALASTDRALAIDARLAEALFNRALILERLGLRGEARAAWQRYLEVDPSSQWASEAREHLARLGAARAAPPFEADRQQLELAAAAGDEPVVRALVDRHRERARAFAEAEYLGRWAEASQRGDAAGAARWLTVSRNIGAALVRVSGESLLRDAVQTIDAVPAAQQARIAGAHLAYRRGRIAFSRGQLAAAETDLRLAAAQFAAAGDPMSLAARSYAAGARLAQSGVAEATRELRALVAELDSGAATSRSAVRLVSTDAQRARELASRALETYAAHGMTALLAQPYLVRARASLQLGERDAAARDLADGIAAVEHHPDDTGVLDAGRALFEEAILLDLERKDVASVFMHAERRRGVVAGANALDELRARLAGSGTAIITTVVLPRELVVLAVTEGGASVSRHPISREDVIATAARGDDAALHDLLIRPAAAALAGARALIVVPDKLLERVSYAGLRDRTTSQAVIERMPVSVAASASSLRASSVAPYATMAAIELPSGTTAGTAALPEAELELPEIGDLYRTVRQVRGDAVTADAVETSAAAADVLHIAGHTAGDAATGGESLAAAGGAISWRTIAAMRGMPPVVVLSACNTLRRPDDPGRRALSLGGAFVAAGAQDVVGTLAPIGDRDARSLFLALHEQLARGVAAPEALRRVQLLQQQRPGGAWRRLALLTTVIHRTTD